ncbi:MAG: tRNA (guanosine(37)-N1)-methyltransferase TrmD [Gammaproteobacteria bacterium]|jgi:tRNA (guanine37-N1)-methyltransferase
MRAHVVTLFPEMFAPLTQYGVVSRAISEGRVELEFWNPRDYARDRHHTVDDRPYGGGPGMLMKVAPLRAAIADAKAELPSAKVIYLSPQGRLLDHRGAQALAAAEEMVLVAGRYEGIDQRVIDADVDEEWSVGDYVLSGGELAVMVLIDAVARLLPGVLGDDASAAQDSFVDGILDHPHYTRPRKIDGMEVPSVLGSGNHAEVARWRRKQALGRTWKLRPDLFDDRRPVEEERVLLSEYILETLQS